MEKILTSGLWILWFYILVLYPFNLYDFIKDKKKSNKSYLKIAFDTIVVIVSIIFTFASNIDFSISNFALYLLLGLAYLQSILDYFDHKTKRNAIFIFAFSFFIILYIVLIKVTIQR